MEGVVRLNLSTTFAASSPARPWVNPTAAAHMSRVFDLPLLRCVDISTPWFLPRPPSDIRLFARSRSISRTGTHHPP